MQNDTLFPKITHVLEACPLQAGPLYTTLKDLALSVEWRDLRIIELGSSGWGIIIGRKRSEDSLRIVLPLPLHTTSLKPSSLKAIFAAIALLDYTTLPEPLPALAPDLDELRQQINPSHSLTNLAADGGEDKLGGSEKEKSEAVVSKEIEKEMIYMAIVSEDSTVVYYKLTKGIKKPADIPDE